MTNRERKCTASQNCALKNDAESSQLHALLLPPGFASLSDFNTLLALAPTVRLQSD
jgi:hypothetical protein